MGLEGWAGRVIYIYIEDCRKWTTNASILNSFSYFVHPFHHIGVIDRYQK